MFCAICKRKVEMHHLPSCIKMPVHFISYLSVNMDHTHSSDTSESSLEGNRNVLRQCALQVAKALL